MRVFVVGGGCISGFVGCVCVRHHAKEKRKE